MRVRYVLPAAAALPMLLRVNLLLLPILVLPAGAALTAANPSDDEDDEERD